MRFEIDYEIHGTTVIEAETKEEAQNELEADIDWTADVLPGKTEWYITGISEES